MDELKKQSAVIPANDAVDPESLPPQIADVLTRLEPEARAVIIRAVSHAGPIPHPDVLDGYPPAVQEQIIEWADRQQRHRMDLERRVENRGDRGQWITGVVAISSIVASSTVAILTKDWVAAGIIMAIGVGGPSAAMVISHGLAQMIARKSAPPPSPPARPKKRRRP